jgi:hypothetical protein
MEFSFSKILQFYFQHSVSLAEDSRGVKSQERRKASSLGRSLPLIERDGGVKD